MKVASKPTAQKDPLANPGNQVGQPGERESVLLALSTALAGIRERKELFGTIIEKIRPVIPVDDTGLLVLDKTGRYWQDWTNVDNYQGHAASTQLKQMGYDGLLPVDRWMEYTLNHTGIMTVGKFKEQYPEHPFGPVMWEAGLREMMFAPLVHRGDRLGVLFFDSQQAGTYSETHLPLFQAVADLIAVAVANILANEEILEREREKTHLLGISEAISRINNRKELLRVIYQHIQPVFPFDSAGLFITDVEKDILQEILDSEAFPDPLQHTLTEQNLLGPWKLSASNPDSWWMQEQPVIRSMAGEAALCEKYLGEAQFREGLAYGLQQFIGGPMYANGKKIGAICFNSVQEHFYTQAHEPLFRSISEQVAVAVANILANEEILEREREKALLLSLSEDMATIRDRDDLWRVMMEKIRPLVSFQDGGCFLINKTEHTYQPFLFNDFQGYFQQEPYRAYIGAHLPLEGSPAEWIKGQQSPFYYTQQQAAARFPHESGVQLATQVGLKSFVALQLHWNRQLIGLLILGYPGEDGNRNEALLKAIADQVAVAVANILANEEILQREQEKALLLSLSEDMATIRDRNDLWRVMMGKIKPLVGFDDAVVIVLSTDQQRLLHLLTMPTDERRANAHYQQVVSQWFVVKDSPFEWMINRQGNYQWDTQELAALYPDYPGIRLMQETNLRHTLHYKLNWGGNNIGFFHFHFTNQAQIDPVKLPLYKGIADQIAVAVANILANEEILEREREKSQLLEITELIAQVKATDDLLRLIVEKIKPLFGFHDCGLFVVSADGKTHSDLAAVLPDVSPSQWNETIAAVSANIPHRGSPIEWMMQELSAVSEPVLVDFKALAEKYPEYPQFAGTGLLEMGYRDCLTANLTVRGKPIGLFCINALKKDFFPRAVYPLFQSVTHNIAIAVANIRANEEILEREREKALLLDVSEAIATVRDKDALFAVLMEKIKPLVRFDNNATIFLFDKEKTYYSFWLHKLYQADSATPDFEAWTQKKTLVREDPLAQFLIAHRKAVIISIEEAVTKFPDQAAVQWARQIGLKQALHVPLQVGGDLIGFLSFDTLTDHAFSESQFPLVQSVADQVAVAVANILANEEILEREREKSRLLEISKAIAQISHRDDLLQVIIGHVKPLFHFDENALFVIDRDGKQYRMWYDNLLQPYEEGKRSQQGVGIPMKGNQVAEDVFRDRPAYLRDREEMLAFSAGNASLTEWIVASGIEEVMIGPLKVGGQIMGCFNSHSRRKGTFSSSMLPLYQNVCDQVAVAVANILANEEILERETEKATLLSLSEDMATIRDRDDLLNIILQKIKPIVGFNDAVISVYTPDFLSYKHFVTASPPERIAHPFYKEIVGVYLPLVGHPDEFVLGQIKAIEVLRWDTLDIQEAYPNNLIGCFLEENNLHYNLYMKLSWAGEIIGFMSFHFSQQASIQKTKYTLYKAIANQVAVAVANVLANEEILEREREKTQLLKVSEAISTIRDATSLFSSLSDIIRSIIAFDEAPMIFLLDEQRQHYRIFYSKVFDPSANLSSLEAWQQGKNKVATDPIATYLIGQNRTLVLNLKQAMEQWGDFPGKQTMLDLALAECLVAPLRVKDRLSGFLCVWSRSEGKFETPKLNLFQSIADQVAVAVANILANEEILLQKQAIEEREREKSLQLNLSTALAGTPDWEGRFDQVSRLIGQLMPWSVFSVSLSGPGYTRTYRFQQANAAYSPLPTRQLQRDTGLPLDTLLGMQQADRSFYATAGLYLSEHYEALRAAHPYVEMMHQYYQIRSMAVVPLPMDIAGRGESALVVESTHPSGFTPEQFSCLQRLGSYIGLVTEKLLAFEDIQKREREKSLQLAINNLLVTLKDRDVLFGTMASEINKVVPCQFFVVRVLRRAGGTQYRVLLERQLPEGFLKVWEGTDDYPPLPDAEAHPLTPEMENQPGVYVGEAFQAFCGQSPLYRTALEKQGARSALRLQFPLSDELDTVMVLADSLPFAFTEEDFALLGQLTPQISLALDNLFAFEKIASLQALLEGEKAYLQEEIKGSYNFEEIIGSSPALREVFTKISKVAPTDTTVLILGETGTGKELIARAVHNLSRRKDRVLIKVNCAALPPQLIESDLFGHERGAFTGAHERRIGKFELANGGTLFLDEIGELPLELQAKLLRVLQEGEFERLGGKGTLKTDVRIIAATNRELENESEAGKFRPDLYYRLNVFPITLPPLRERKEDIPLLAMHFTQKFAQKMGKKIRSISNEALQEMLSYRWPGNIRELEHIVERSVILSGTSTLELSNPLKRTKLPAMGEAGPPPVKTLKEAEKELIIAVLQLTGGRIRGKGAAAEVLDIEPTTLEARMKKLGIVKKLVVAKD
jgi:transcriptional regulator with GAF, ATPase, and Fis domain